MRKKKNPLVLPILLFVGVLVISIVGLLLAQNLRKAEIEKPKQYSNQDDIPRVTIQETYKAIQNGEAVIIDTRSAQEFSRQHIINSINLPADQIEARLGELDPEIWYLTYCT